MARKGIDVGKNFVNPPNQHIKNEKRYIHELRVNGCVTKGSYFQKNSNWHAKNRGCNLLNKS